MGWNDHLEDDGFKGFVREVIDGNHLEGAALGIAKLVADKGLDVLSAKQRHVFDRNIADEFTYDACARCASSIPWCEMYHAWVETGGLCNYCWHMSEKEKAD